MESETLCLVILDIDAQAYRVNLTQAQQIGFHVCGLRKTTRRVRIFVLRACYRILVRHIFFLVIDNVEPKSATGVTFQAGAVP